MSLAAYASETNKPLPQLKPAEKSVIEINGEEVTLLFST